MSRVAGHRGRQPVKPPEQRFPLRWVHEYTGALPAPQYPVDVSGGITDFLMLGNGPDPTLTPPQKPVGDCTFAAEVHYEMTKAAASGAPMPAVTSDEVVSEYFAYDHGQDRGAVIADLLLYWYRAGTILAFAPVDHTDRAACDAAMQQFKGLYLGVDLTDDADARFQAAEPWSVAGGQQPDPDDGHCILRVKSTGAGPDAMSTDVTWGAEQESTAAWDAACVVEAWVAIMSEDEIDPAALAALRADIDALGGTGGDPAPSPAPEPAPDPGPAPDPAPIPITDPDILLADIGRLARDIAADSSRDISELIAFLHSFGL